jgi:hypothetical protein
MIINKRITLIKYLNSTNVSISSFQNIQTVYSLVDSVYKFWNKNSFNFGEEQDFYDFEYGKSYIIISENDSSYTIDVGSSDVLTTVVVSNAKQADIYKGPDLGIENYENITTVYKVSDLGNSWNLWNKISYSFGEEQDFYNFVDNGLYILISNNVPYTLWSSDSGEEHELATEAGESLMTEDNYVLIV